MPEPSPTAPAPRLSVLMPVYNERATLLEILHRVQEVPVEKEIIIVDNCSTDGTREVLQEMLSRGAATSGVPTSGDVIGESTLRVVLREKNLGKGASVRRALELARGEFVIVQDADLEYDPRDYLKLLQAARRGYEVVFGTRLLPGTASRLAQPRTAFFYGRVGLSVLLRVLYGVPISDVATCYKLLRREVALGLHLQSSGFDLDFEIGAKVARARRRGALRYSEVPISYTPRTELEGKKIRVVRDGVRAAWALIKYRWKN